jgi:hypothetical protein
MNENNSIKCLFRLHNYEVYKEIDLIDVRKDVIGTIIVSRCTCCDKIKTTEIRTVNNHSI